MNTWQGPYNDTEPEEDLPEASVHTRYEFDCPECSEVVDLGDVDESGAVVECDTCHARIKLTQGP